MSLSRAKEGLFILGNLDQMCRSSPVWQKIRTSLEESNSVGDGITIMCQNHLEVVRTVRSANEFFSETPEGRCTKPCSFPLPNCNHPCPRQCHPIDESHDTYKCAKPCDKRCIRNHSCPLQCYEPCLCKKSVQKTLPCGHSHELPCHEDSAKCPTIVVKTYPVCSHKVPLQCYISLDKVPCKSPCNQIMSCGHPCLLRCHVTEDPDHQKTKCCHPCEKKCSNGHQCNRVCSVDCPPCEALVEKLLPCDHNQMVPCSILPEDVLCSVKVRKVLEPCNHDQEIECNLEPESNQCTLECGQQRNCGHLCDVTCGSSQLSIDLLFSDHSTHLKEPCWEQCSKLNKNCKKNHYCKLKCYEECQICCVKIIAVIPDCLHNIEVSWQNTFKGHWAILIMHPRPPGRHKDRQLTTNFELWVEIFCVPTCFHMTISLYPEKRNHPGFVNISLILVNDASMERSLRVIQHANRKIWIIFKKVWNLILSVPRVSVPCEKKSP